MGDQVADWHTQPQEIWPMQWGHIQRNGLFPDVVGIWVSPGGSVTWNESDPYGAPNHWRVHQGRTE